MLCCMRNLPVCALLILALMLLSGAGCSSSHLSARDLPTEFRAETHVGRDQLQLRGLSSSGVASTAIGAGDLLEILVTTGRSTEEAEPITTRVSEEGVVNIPYIGPVALAGVEPSLAATRVAAVAVQRGVYVRPQVNVVVAEQATNRVTVLGAVSEPGVQEVPRSACDVLAAIAHAGGFTEEAGTVVEILRHEGPQFASGESSDEIQQASFQTSANKEGASPQRSSRTQEIDLAQLDPTRPSQYHLADRDVVVVRPREKRLVHVTGLVEQPAQFELANDQDLRVLDAIAMAGGTTSPVADKVVVIRHVESQTEPIVAQLSISRAKRDGSENLILQAGDLISVEQTVATATIDTLRDLFRITMGVGGNLTLF